MTIAILLVALALESWQDWKDGEVSLWLMVLSVIVTTLVGWDDVQWLSGLVTGVVVGILVMIKKMGGADVIIIIQLALILGVMGIVMTMFIASLVGLTWGLVVWLRSREKDFMKMPIRFIPCLGLGTVVTLIIN